MAAEHPANARARIKENLFIIEVNLRYAPSTIRPQASSETGSDEPCAAGQVQSPNTQPIRD
jgi:hypothetical protein